MYWLRCEGNHLSRRLGLATLVLLLLTSCGLLSERSFYEGIRANQKSRSPTGAEGATTKQLPDYDQYKAERDAVTKGQR